MTASGQAYYGHYGGLSVDDYVRLHVRGNATEMDRMRRMVGLVPAGVASVLDVGAGHGVFLQELAAARGITGTGIEITPAKVDYARSQGVDLRLGDAGALAFEDRAFDAVVCTEVLEHLPHGVYEAACAELSRVADRWVLLSVPFDERRRFIACPYCGARVNPDYHFRSFAPGRIAGLLPGYRLHAEHHLGRSRHNPLVHWARRFVERWPAMLLCPCCGYAPPAQPAAAAGAVVPAQSSLARRLAT
ncbi:MAG: class I SAM-dependent methyltransferase, partial [Aquabacterium sp.]